MKIQPSEKDDRRSRSWAHVDTNETAWLSKLMFWKHDDEKDDDHRGETFITKRQKEAKKRKKRVTAYVMIGLTLVGTLIGVGVPLLSHLNVGAQNDVPSKNLTNTASDEAARQILEGKTVKVAGKGSRSAKKTLTSAEAQKRIKAAVQDQANKDKDALNKRNDQISKLQSQVDTLTKANQSMTDKNSSSDASASSAASEAQSQIDQYKKQASDAQAKADSLKSQLDDANNKLKQAQSAQSSSPSSSADAVSSSK